MPQTKISLVVPIYNEEGNIEELYQRSSKSLAVVSPDYEIILVNDGSADDSLKKILELSLLDPKVKYINFSRNFGHQQAVSAGLDQAKGEAVIIMDGDLQDPPELIPELYEKYKSGYEVVYAKRRQREGESFLKKVTAKWFYRFINKMTSVPIPVDTGDFRLIDYRVVHYLREMPEHNKFLRGQIAWLGFRQTEVLFDRDARKSGKTGYSFSQMMRFAMDGITGFSDKPLYWVTRMGFFISLISFFIIIYALYSHFFLERTITGWTSLIISSAFLGGVQLFALGILGEYIARINTNVQNRPLYIVESSNIKKDEVDENSD